MPAPDDEVGVAQEAAEVARFARFGVRRVILGSRRRAEARLVDGETPAHVARRIASRIPLRVVLVALDVRNEVAVLAFRWWAGRVALAFVGLLPAAKQPHGAYRHVAVARAEERLDLDYPAERLDLVYDAARIEVEAAGDKVRRLTRERRTRGRKIEFLLRAVTGPERLELILIVVRVDAILDRHHRPTIAYLAQDRINRGERSQPLNFHVLDRYVQPEAVQGRHARLRDVAVSHECMEDVVDHSRDRPLGGQVRRNVETTVRVIAGRVERVEGGSRCSAVVLAPWIEDARQAGEQRVVLARGFDHLAIDSAVGHSRLDAGENQPQTLAAVEADNRVREIADEIQHVARACIAAERDAVADLERLAAADGEASPLVSAQVQCLVACRGRRGGVAVEYNLALQNISGAARAAAQRNRLQVAQFRIPAARVVSVPYLEFRHRVQLLLPYELKATQ